MKDSTCPQQPQILRETRGGSLSPTAREHLDHCQACFSAVEIDRLLAADAGRVPSLEELPDPTLIWWRSRQLAQLRQADRATYPIQLVERLAMVLGALGLSIGVSLAWPTLRGTVDHWIGSWAKGLSQSLPMQGSSLVLALSCSLFVLVGFGLYSQWAER